MKGWLKDSYVAVQLQVESEVVKKQSMCLYITADSKCRYQVMSENFTRRNGIILLAVLN